MPKKPVSKKTKKAAKSVKAKTEQEKTPKSKKSKEEKMAAKFQVEEITDKEEETTPEPKEEISPDVVTPPQDESLVEPAPQTTYQPETQSQAQDFPPTPPVQQPPAPPQEEPPFGQPEIPQYPEKKFPLKTIVIVVILILLLGGVVFGAVQVYQKAVKKQAEATPSPSPLPQETTLPSPEISPGLESTESATPSAEEEESKREDLKVKVLNGGGVAGAAGKVATALEKLGYENVRTGNADNFDYEKSEITYLEAKEEFLSMFENDLKDYEIGTKTATDSADFDFVFILGEK